MTIYFVRHGESTVNAGTHWKSPESTPLTEVGKAQSQKVAKRLSSLKFDCFMSSTHLRAKETSVIISNKVGLSPEFTDLLCEARKPSFVMGKSKTDSDVKQYDTQYRDHWGEDWHFSDEENFMDLKKRAETFLSTIENSSYDTVLVVTHGRILRMILALMIFGKELTGSEQLKIADFLETKNTGITIAEFKDNERWVLLTWNDHHHLT